jgi:hypothetical protein
LGSLLFTITAFVLVSLLTTTTTTTDDDEEDDDDDNCRADADADADAAAAAAAADDDDDNTTTTNNNMLISLFSLVAFCVCVLSFLFQLWLLAVDGMAWRQFCWCLCGSHARVWQSACVRFGYTQRPPRLIEPTASLMSDIDPIYGCSPGSFWATACSLLLHHSCKAADIKYGIVVMFSGGMSLCACDEVWIVPDKARSTGSCMLCTLSNIVGETRS